MELDFLALTPLAVLILFFGAAFAFAFYRNQSLQKSITIGTLIAVLILESALLSQVWDGGPTRCTLRDGLLPSASPWSSTASPR